MNLGVTLTISGFGSRSVRIIRSGIEDTTGLHARIAMDAEAFVKFDIAPRITPGQHSSAGRLGAAPTGHLERAYAGIEAVSDANEAALIIPRASRLRAAFGAYTVLPVNGAKFLTIPANKDAYGRRAREFSNLFPIRSKAGKLLLVRKDAGGNLEAMYSLVPKADIPEDRTLLPFPEIRESAAISAEKFIDEKIAAAI